MNILAKLAVVSLAVAGTSSVLAADLIVTHSAGKRGMIASIDLSTEGNASAFEFRLSIPKGVKTDVSKCVAEVPKSHQAQCVAKEGEIHGMVWSNSNEKLPSGIVSVGTVSFGGAQPAQLIEVLVADANAQPIHAKATIE